MGDPGEDLLVGDAGDDRFSGGGDAPFGGLGDHDACHGGAGHDSYLNPTEDGGFHGGCEFHYDIP